MYNVTINFAHGISHVFTNLNQLQWDDLRACICNFDKKFTFEYDGVQYVINPEFVCSVVAKEV